MLFFAVLWVAVKVPLLAKAQADEKLGRNGNSGPAKAPGHNANSGNKEDHGPPQVNLPAVPGIVDVSSKIQSQANNDIGPVQSADSVVERILAMGALAGSNYNETAMDLRFKAQLKNAYARRAKSMAKRVESITQRVEMLTTMITINTRYNVKMLNRYYMDLMHTSYLERKKNARYNMDEKIYQRPEDAKQENLTASLNWMLREVAASPSAREFTLDSDDTTIPSLGGIKLSPEEIQHIRLTDGSVHKGQALSFSAGNPHPLDARWPYRAARSRVFIAPRGV